MRLRAAGWAGVVAALAALATVLAGSAVATTSAVAAPQAAQAPRVPATRTLILPSPAGPRTAIVYRPASLGRNPPLVVVIHGAGGSGEQVRSAFGWDGLADRDGFEVAYPNGLSRFWNAGFCCGVPHSRNVDDVGFLHELVHQLRAEDGVDSRRVYAVGMSNGAMMAYAWACGRPGDLAGIGPVAGALVAPCHPGPVTVVAVHGTADRNVPLGGGVGPRSVSHYPYPSVVQSLAPFVAADQCAPAPRRTDQPPVQLTSWTCAGDRSVTLAVVTGLGHEWPGSKVAGPGRWPTRQPAPPPLNATTFLWSHLRGSTLS